MRNFMFIIRKFILIYFDFLFVCTTFAAEMQTMNYSGPTDVCQRHLILDVLRGVALLGIALANFPEFALWTFLSDNDQAMMPTAAVDHVIRYLQYLLVDGKFYTIFSLLFGIGFSLILVRHGRRLFIRRMLLLVCIGFLHLMFIWSGDILLLYAIGGLLLSLLNSISDKVLLVMAIVLFFIPVGLDAITELCGIDFAAPFYKAWWSSAEANGINEDNFASWLRDAKSYEEMFAFLIQGAYERLWEFVGGHRLPKVLGLFILGYLAGKHHLYARLKEIPLKHTLFISLIIGLPTSLLYAWSATHDHLWGLTAHSLLYAVSVIPMACVYINILCLLYLRYTDTRCFLWVAAPGRMALTNYISQSLIGIVLFYGIGFGLGTSFGLVYIELIALAVFVFQIICSSLWFRLFRFGPLEWLWRIFTYGRYFSIRYEK